MECGEISGLTVTRNGARRGEPTPWRQPVPKHISGALELLLSEKEARPCEAEPWSETKASSCWGSVGPWAQCKGQVCLGCAEFGVSGKRCCRKAGYLWLCRKVKHLPAQTRSHYGLLFCGFCWPTHLPQSTRRGQVKLLCCHALG